MGKSTIEWTEATWNPVAGCKMVSPGCTNCYAMRMAARLEAMGHDKYQGTTRRVAGRSVWTGQVKIHEPALLEPLRWRRPQRIFVNSMSDLFNDGIPIEFVRRVWDVMAAADWHNFQILTKRPARMRDVLKRKFPLLENVWLGTSIESQKYVWRIEKLREVPGHVRFISFEPLLRPVGDVDLTGIDWAIVGGESGPRARHVDPSWVEDIHRQCIEQGVAFFFKQWGGKRKKKSGRQLHGRTWSEYPLCVSM